MNFTDNARYYAAKNEMTRAVLLWLAQDDDDTVEESQMVQACRRFVEAFDACE